MILKSLIVSLFLIPKLTTLPILIFSPESYYNVASCTLLLFTKTISLFYSSPAIQGILDDKDDFTDKSNISAGTSVSQ